MPTPAVSIVVPTRGGAHRLPVLMEALASQVLEEPWEVVVVLDGDVDGSSVVLAQYADRLPLRILKRTGGEGVSPALHAGYGEARGDIVIRCDDDLTPRPDFVARHLHWHRSRPAGAPPLGVIAMTRDVFDPSIYADAYGIPANRRLLDMAYARPVEERWKHWAACNSVPKAAYEASGGFDPSMIYREDSELGLRLVRSGVEMVIDPELEIEHRGPALDTAARAGRAFTSGASTRAFDQRHPGTQASADATRRGPWGHAVALAAGRIGSREDAVALGRRIDCWLPRLPPRVRSKAVAWAVEAAAVAGNRVGDLAWIRASEMPGPVQTVSVVIPHHGDPEPTVRLVEQLKAQTHRAQIIVADDASSPPFPELVGVEVVRRARNGGFGANANSGAARATGDALLVLNSDLTVPRGFLADMVAAARRHPGSVLSPRVVDEHGTEAWIGRDFPRPRHAVAAWLTPLAGMRDTTAWHRAVGHNVRSRTDETEVDWVVGAAMWIPLHAFRSAGGFDERFFMNSEEIDLQRRLNEQGIRSVALRAPTVIHTGGGSSPSEARRGWLVEGALIYADKWGSRRRLRAALAAATGANFAINTIRLALGRDVRPVEVARTEFSLIRGVRRRPPTSTG